MLVVFFLLILFMPPLSFGQTGDLWFGWPGQIGVKPLDKIYLYPKEQPDHQNYLQSCQYEWWTRDTLANGTVGQIAGTFSQIDCIKQDTLVFEWPKHDSIYVRKRVFWQTNSGGRWATTKQFKVFNPCPTCK